MALATTFWSLGGIWFFIIAFLLIGFFVLEGFDFGVGILNPIVSRDEVDRRMVVASIEPFWDGNEVWLVFAGGAMFATFPDWYATLFSGFYLPLFLILLGLILRGVAIDYRSKRAGAGWRRRWDAALAIGCALPAFLWGVALVNFVNGVPIDRDREFTGGILDLLNGYSLLGGVVSFFLFSSQGAVFLSLRTRGDLRLRARRAAYLLAVPTAAATTAFLVWSAARAGDVNAKWAISAVLAIAALALVVAAALLVRAGRELVAFTGTAGAIVLLAGTLFYDLYPRLIASSTDSAFSLTVFNSSASHYALTAMTIVFFAFSPIVFLYESWSYWTLRHRLDRDHFEEPKRPSDAIAESGLRESQQ